MRKYYLECECCTPEHRLVFNYNPVDKELWTEVYLHQPRRFFTRCWVALLYILNRTPKWGHFDCFLAYTPEKIGEMYEFLSQAYSDSRQVDAPDNPTIAGH